MASWTHKIWQRFTRKTGKFLVEWYQLNYLLKKLPHTPEIVFCLMNSVYQKWLTDPALSLHLAFLDFHLIPFFLINEFFSTLNSAHLSVYTEHFIERYWFYVLAHEEIYSNNSIAFVFAEGVFKIFLFTDNYQNDITVIYLIFRAAVTAKISSRLGKVSQFKNSFNRAFQTSHKSFWGETEISFVVEYESKLMNGLKVWHKMMSTSFVFYDYV